MICISIPDNNKKERKYILDIFFNEFLGLSYRIVENTDIKNWEIELENGSKLIIEDHFFNKYPTELNYLKLENIPSKVEYIENKFTPEDECSTRILQTNSVRVTINKRTIRKVKSTNMEAVFENISEMYKISRNELDSIVDANTSVSEVEVKPTVKVSENCG